MIKPLYLFLIVLGACETQPPCRVKVCTTETTDIQYRMGDETFSQPVTTCVCVDPKDGGSDVGR